MIAEFLDWVEYGKFFNQSWVIYGGIFLAVPIIAWGLWKWLTRDIV